jgi:hypothetical protein
VVRILSRTGPAAAEQAGTGEAEPGPATEKAA